MLINIYQSRNAQKAKLQDIKNAVLLRKLQKNYYIVILNISLMK